MISIFKNATQQFRNNLIDDCNENKYVKCVILMSETFAERNFRSLSGFLVFSRKFIPANNL